MGTRGVVVGSESSRGLIEWIWDCVEGGDLYGSCNGLVD